MADDTDVATATTGTDAQVTTTTNDVKGSAEETTATTTSGSEENQQTDGAENAVTDEAANKTVPYSRFAEVNSELRTTKAELLALKTDKKVETPPADADVNNPQLQVVKANLKKLGFVDKAEVEAELSRIKEDTAVQNSLTQLETRYDGKDGRPKFDRTQVLEFALDRQIGDLETAYKALNEKALIDWHIRQAAGKTTDIKTEASDGSGSQEPGTPDSALLEGASKGDKTALHTLLKRRIRVAQTKSG